MTRFSLTRLAPIVSATCCLACSGQTVQGAWVGGFPADDSKECLIQLKDDNHFSISCLDTRLLAVGHYGWDGKTLEFRTELMSVNKSILSAKPVYHLSVLGRGNLMDLATQDRTYSWRRRSR